MPVDSAHVRCCNMHHSQRNSLAFVRDLQEVSFDRLLVPVSPVTYDDLSEREASQRLLSMGPADSVSTTRSNSTGTGSVYSSGSVRKFRGNPLFAGRPGLPRDHTSCFPYCVHVEWKEASNHCNR